MFLQDKLAYGEAKTSILVRKGSISLEWVRAHPRSHRVSGKT